MKKKYNDLLKNGTLSIESAEQLKRQSFANLFDVVNRGEKSYFNLCKGISFGNVDSIDQSLYTDYVINEVDTWTSISYKFYNTIELWWLICKFNRYQRPI